MPDDDDTLGAVLITNTTLVETARLLTGEHEERDFDGHEERDFDLSDSRPSSHPSSAAVRRLREFAIATQAIVLNENVNTLPCQWPPDAQTSEFLLGLRREGIIQPLRRLSITEQALQRVYKLLGPIGNDGVYAYALDKSLGVIQDLEIGSAYEHREAHDELRDAVWDDSAHQISMASHLKGHPRRRSAVISARSRPPEGDAFTRFLTGLRSDLACEVSPNTSYVVNQIRNVFYWVLAEQAGIPYSPDIYRSEWTHQWLKSWRDTLSNKIYEIVAEAFSTSAKEVADGDASQTVLMPPIAATVAERAGSPNNVLEALLEVRTEFSPMRRALTELEGARRGGQSIRERRAAATRISKILESVRTRHAPSSGVTLESAFGYTEDVAKIVQDPTRPASYVKLAEKGARFVREWWMTRPVHRLNRMVTGLEKSFSYGTAASRLVGRPLAPGEIESLNSAW